MINLRVIRDNSKNRTKSIYTGNKSHTASMNLRVSQEFPAESALKNISNRYEERNEEKSKSAKKYKHSITLQETTINLVKKDLLPQRRPSRVPETERACRETTSYKRSVDNSQQGLLRLRTDVNEDHEEREADRQSVEVSVEEITTFMKKLKEVKNQRDALAKELKFYKKHSRNEATNSVLRALRL